MKKRKLILLIIVFFSIVLYFWRPLQSRVIEDNTCLNTKVLVVAHRGSHHLAPENSLAAIQQSIANEIDFVELDVRATLDNKLVIIHDDALERTTNGSGKIEHQKLSDIKKYYLKSGNKPSNEKVPTLEEALLLAREKILVNLDLKVTDDTSLKNVYHLIEELNMEESVILSISNLKLIPKLREMNDAIQIMPVVNTGKKLNRALAINGTKVIQVKQESIPPILMDKIEKRQILIWRNALKKYDRLEQNGEDGFRKLVTNHKVDFIQTDYPEKLLKFLKENELHP